MTCITITFPAVRASTGVLFRAPSGEVHALLGENGAGKSTLIKALTDVHRLEAGEIRLRVERRDVRSPAGAQAARMCAVHQVNLAANLSVAESHTIAGQQFVAIARAVEIDTDRIIVLRSGRLVGAYPTAELPRIDLVAKMIGRQLEQLEQLEYDSHDGAASRPVPSTSKRPIGRRTGLVPLAIELRAGEVLGVADPLGSGRTETARLVFGLDRSDSGSSPLGVVAPARDLVDHPLEWHGELRMDAYRHGPARARRHRHTAGDHPQARLPCMSAPS
jgi:ABC-type sugar transport system ATPase subunit